MSDMSLRFGKICAAILIVFLCMGLGNRPVFAEEALPEDSTVVKEEEVLVEEITEKNEWTEDGSGYEYQEDNSIALFSGQIEYTDTVSDAADVLRREMICRNGVISIYYQGEYVSGMSKDILETAVSYDDSLPGMAGDYLRYNYNRVVRRTYKGINGDGEYYRFEYELYYLSSYEQELAVENKILEILDSLDVYASDRETQIRSVYTYITSNVRYDNTIYDTFNVHSAYGAAVEGKAVCQGYSLLLYRLLQELGIKNRMIPGEAGGINHVWNIVEMDGRGYNLDPTWDWGKEAGFDWFLKGSETFALSHSRNSEYLSEEFMQQYVMAEKDYGCAEEEKDALTLFVERCYELILGRGPDAAGMEFWKNELETDGADVFGILDGFFNSAEFMQQDNAVLNIPDILVRMAEDAAIIENAPEEIQWKVLAFVYRQYSCVLERQPDQQGRDDWYHWLAEEKETAQSVVYGFVFSQETIHKNLADEEYVKLLYRVFMGREYDLAGLRDWMNGLEDGMSRKEVFDGFSASEEFKEIVKTYGL
mgnify:CR=1 FL=1